MRILLIGSGGREHALAHTFKKQGHTVYPFPGNGGITQIADPLPGSFLEIDPNDFESLADCVQAEGVDLTVVGPEAPLEKGIADIFKARSLPLFGPTKQGATLESSKVFAKQFMQKYQIPTGESVICKSPEEGEAAIEKYFDLWGGVVVKPSGLTAGKGVMVCRTKEEAIEAVDLIMKDKLFGESGEEVVLEELLLGKEVSLLAFCDGKSIKPMLPSQDHKALYEGNTGPNTGGVGAYAPVPFLSDEDHNRIDKEIVQRTLFGLKQEGIPYVGVIYFGMMLTEKGPKVLEYNCRFGDPETQVVVPLLKTDLAEVMLACCYHSLDTISLEWSDESACCVILTSNGYPGTFEKGFTISGIEIAEAIDRLVVFHSGTAKNASGDYVTAGGRVVGITGFAPTLGQAVEKAYDGVKKVHFNEVYFRKDIARGALLNE